MIKEKEKAMQRAAGKKARSSLGEDERREKSDAICLAAAESRFFEKAEKVLLYNAVGAEVSCEALGRILESRGVAPAFPRSVAPGLMEALLPRESHRFTPDFYGIPSPDPEFSSVVPPETLEAVVVPLTAFDADCGRVGMGAGVYDRYLARCTGAARIGLAFSVQQAEKVDAESTDAVLDAVYTESGVFEACNSRWKRVK